MRNPGMRRPRDPGGQRLQDRLDARRRMERHVSEQLDLEQLLAIAVESALQLIGGGVSIIYLCDGDVLSARAWTKGGEWIRGLRVPVGSGVMGKAVATGEGM